MDKGKLLSANGHNDMSDLEKIKQIAEEMPDSPEKEQGLQAYENLKIFEEIANALDKVVTQGGLMEA